MSESRASAAPSDVSQDNADSEEQIQPVVAVILAAGLGVRFDESNPKQLVQVGGKPIITWSIDAFQSNARVTDILVVVNDRVREAVEAIVSDDTYDKVRTVIQGGIEREDSTEAALQTLADAEIPRMPSCSSTMRCGPSSARSPSMAASMPWIPSRPQPWPWPRPTPC